MHRRSVSVTCLVLLAVATIARGDEPPLAVAVDGEPFHATFAGAKADGVLQFRVNDQERAIPAADLVSWGRFVDPAPGLHVILAGGGVLVTNTARLADDQLSGESVTFGKWSLPLDAVAGVVLRAPHDRAAADKLQARVAAATGRHDRLLLDNGDEVSGTLTVLDDTKAVLRGETGTLDFKIDALAAVIFDPSLASPRRPNGLRVLVGFQDGSLVTASKLSSEGANTTLALPAGVELSTATSWIVALQPLGGRVEYLSDLKPASYRHIPYLDLTWPYRDDRSVGESRMRVGRQLYLKGLGMHSPARITYVLDGDYRRFEAEVALDDESQQRGSVVFRVFVDDGSGGWQEKATSAIQRGGQVPLLLSAAIAGAKRISLLVDFADRGDELDHADWLNARLVR